MEEFVLDAFSKAEHASRAYNFNLVFKRKIFINPRKLPESPVEANLLAYQVYITY
jgi:hypothetical protein